MALTLDNVVAGLRFGGFAPEGLSITCVYTCNAWDLQCGWYGTPYQYLSTSPSYLDMKYSWYVVRVHKYKILYHEESIPVACRLCIHSGMDV